MKRLFLLLILFSIFLSGDIEFNENNSEVHTVTVDGTNLRFYPDSLTINEAIGTKKNDSLDTKDSRIVWGLDGDDIINVNDNSFKILIGGKGNDTFNIDNSGLAIIIESENSGENDLIDLSSISFDDYENDFFGIIDDKHLFAYDRSNNQSVVIIDAKTNSGVEKIRLNG